MSTRVAFAFASFRLNSRLDYFSNYTIFSVMYIRKCVSESDSDESENSGDCGDFCDSSDSVNLVKLVILINLVILVNLVILGNLFFFYFW